VKQAHHIIGMIIVTIVDLVHFSGHPVVDAHFLCGDRRLVYLLHLRHRLLLTPELGALFHVEDRIPSVVVYNSTGLRLPIYPKYIDTNDR